MEPTAPPDTDAAKRSVVYVIDDEPVVRSLFERICQRQGLRSQTFATAEHFLEAYDPATPGCLVVDIYLPTMTGLELLEEITRRGWRIPMIVMSGRAEVSEAVRAFKAGSMDFLEKPFERDAIEAAIRRAIDDDLAYRSGAERRNEIEARIASLTRRETQVMQHVVAGRSNKEIASELGVSPKTIEVHRANVMHKMRADSLAALVKMAMEAGADAPPRSASED